MVLRKGFRSEVDSYSGFYENDRTTSTGLAGFVHERGFSRIVLVGLALDFCVRYTAEDGARMGLDVMIVGDGCRAIDSEGRLDAARNKFRDLGISLCSSRDFEP